MLCPSCNHANREEASFCASCGTRMALPCSSCGNEFPAGARFCDSCGTPVQGAGEAVAATPGVVLTEAPPATTEPGPAETVEFLAGLSIFKNVPRDVLEDLAGRVKLVSVPEGPVFMENDPVHELYIIKSGAARVTKAAEGGGPEAVLSILKAGDSFGEIGLIDGLPRSANVTAMQPMECYSLDRDVFFSILDRHPEMARGLFLSLAGMVRNADEWVARTL